MINSIHVGEQAFLFSFFLSFFGLKRRRILRGCSPMQGHCEFVQRVNSAEEKRIPFPFPLLHNTSGGAKCCVRSCSQGGPAETLLQPHRGVVSGAGCWDGTMCAPRWSVHRLKICGCIFCAEEFLSGIAICAGASLVLYQPVSNAISVSQRHLCCSSHSQRNTLRNVSSFSGGEVPAER